VNNNLQIQSADKVCFVTLVFEVMIKTSHLRELASNELFNKALELDGFFGMTKEYAI
jgi:hypothetical protein